MRGLLTILGFMLIGVKSFATHYYVSTAGGNDGNNGTSPSTPFRTISQVNTLSLVHGDNVSFNGGEFFFGTLNITHAGTLGDPIIYNSYGTGQAIISGFTNVTAWTNKGSNIWESTSAVSTLSTCNMVAVNGINTAMGRTPNFPAYYTWSSHTGNSGTACTLTSSNLNSAGTNWAAPIGAEVAFFSTTYIVNRFPITSHSGNTITYDASSLSVYTTPSILFQNSPTYFFQQFIIQNDIRTLDQQNEWYYSPTSKKLSIYSTSTPSGVRMATTTNLVTWASFADNVTINNIAFEGSNSNAINVNGVKGTHITNCSFNFIGGNGIFGAAFGGTFPNNTIDDCSFSDINNGAIDVSERYSIRRYIIRNIGELMGMNSPASNTTSQNSIATGIRVREDSSVISDGVMDSIGYIGIYWYGDRCRVYNNFINHACSLNQLRDGGAIYTWNGASPRTFTDNQIYNNIILNTGSSTAGIFSQGIYFDLNGNGTEVYNNTVQGGEWNIYSGAATFNLNIHNNTCYDAKVSSITIDCQTSPANNFTLKNNIFFAKQPVQFSLWTINVGAATMPLPFTSDSNYFVRPINDNLSIQTDFNGTNTQRNFAGWQQLNSCDAHSHKSPRTVSNINQLFFYYNPTNHDSTVSVINGLDVTNTSFTGTTVLHAFTSLVLISGITIYVSPTGNNTTGDGSSAKPYLTIDKALTVAQFEDVIHLTAGNFTTASRMVFPDGVSLEGVDSNSTHLTLTYYDSTGNDGALLFASGTENTNGAQTISNMWIDGGNVGDALNPTTRGGFSGIFVSARGHVTITQCKFTGFRGYAINLNGSLTSGAAITPSQGNEISFCTFTDCSIRHSVNLNGSFGAVIFKGQKDYKVHDCVFHADGLAPTLNNDIIAQHDAQAHNSGMEFYNNKLYRIVDNGNTFSFFIESWLEDGGMNIHNNLFQGGGCGIDAGTRGSVKGSYPYSWWVHDNTFQLLTQEPTATLAGNNTLGFQFEDACSDGIIENNHFLNLQVAIQFSLSHNIGDINQRNVIRGNLLENMGSSTGAATNNYAITFNIATSATSGNIMQNDSIYNNTIIMKNGRAGIFMNATSAGTMNHIYIENNIVQGTTPYGWLTFAGTNIIDNVVAENNIAWANAFTNNPYYLSPQVSANVTNFTNSGILKVDPLFISTTDFHLQSTSPAIGSGLNPPNTYRGSFSNGTITPTITWNNPAAITFGTALSATQLNATSGGVPGTFAYSPAIGTVPNAGTVTLNLIFTPTDQSTYNTVSKSVTLVVNKATAPLSFSNLTQAYTGAGLAPTVTTIPNGLATVTMTFNGLSTLPINAGTYTVVAGLSNPNYQATPITATFTITKATAILNVANTAAVYDGSQKSVSVTTSPAGLSGVAVTYDGSPTPPTNAGTYAVAVTLTNTNYQATTINTTLVIAKATPTVSWSPATPIVYGTALGGAQLDATSSVAGSFIYTPAAGTIPNAGTQNLSLIFNPTDAANYNSVSGITASIVVTKATAILSGSNLSQVYDGGQKLVTATTNPAGLSGVAITYNGSSTPPVNAGSYSVVITLTNANYQATPVTVTLVISKATAVLSLSNMEVTYNGLSQPATVTTVPSGLNVVSITYDGSSTIPINSGSYSVSATLNNANYQGSITGTLIIDKATAVVSWPTPAAITYGTPLSATQLDAAANGVVPSANPLAGTYTYSPAAGTILNAGVNALTMDFTPTDATNYNPVIGTSVNITVNKATATITVTGFSQPFDGSPKPVTVSTNPAGLGVLSVTYDGSPTAPSAVGSYAVQVTLTNNNYTATTVNGTLVISNSTAAVTISNTSQIYTASPLGVTVTTIPSGLSTDVTYNGSHTVPTNANSYTVVATINDGIHTGSATATFVINKATPTVTWPNPATIVYPAPLSGTQLNAIASVPGSFVYTPPLGTVLNAGTRILSLNFTPTDASNYNSVNGVTATIVVNKATAIINIGDLTQPFDGSPKSVTLTTTPAGLGVLTVTYNGSLNPPSAVGSYPVSVTLSNANYSAAVTTATLTITTTAAGINISNLNRIYTGNPLPVTVTTNPANLPYTITYDGSPVVSINAGSHTVVATINDGVHTGTATGTLVIAKATPTIIWPNPAGINYGTVLTIAQLNATANVAGTFAYAPSSGSLLNVGTQNISLLFTPTDASNYNVATKIVTIVVSKSLAALSLSNLLQVYDGNPKPVVVTTNPAGLSGVTILYNGSLTPPTAAGSYPVTVTLNNNNYTATPISGTLVIAKATSNLTWTAPAQIQYGTPLSGAQLNAASNVAGTFTYSPAVGTVLPIGTHLITATFTPSNPNYSTQTISVPITVYGTPFEDFIISNVILQNLVPL